MVFKARCSVYLSLFLLFFSAVSLPFLSVAAPVTETARVGGSGGGPYLIDCAEDAVLVGIRGHSGNVIDQLRAVCVSVDGQGNWQGTPETYGDQAGGSGGGAFDFLCPNGSAVSGIDAYPSTEWNIDVVGKVSVHCKALSGAKSVSGVQSTIGTTGLEGDELSDLSCADGKAAQGITGRSGSLIDQVALRCNAASNLGKAVITETAEVGTFGGAPFSYQCEDGKVLAGLYGGAGSIIDGIGAVCVEVDETGGWIGAPERSDKAGGAGGGAFELLCPQNHGVSRLDVADGQHVGATLVGKISAFCQPLVSRVTLSGDNEGNVGVTGLSGEPSKNLSCDNMAATGITGRAGAYVDRLGVTCYANPENAGSWSQVYDWPLIGIHSVLTAGGQVMTFGTDDQGVQGAQYYYDVWNPEKGMGADSHLTLSNTLQVDSFCSAPVVVPDTGDILISGGDARYGAGYNKGVVDAVVFDEADNSLAKTADMNSSRWYPTATTLPSGDVLLVAGIDANGYPSITPEIYSAEAKQWRSLIGASSNDAFGGVETRWWYPRQWVAQNGKVFGVSGSMMYYLDTEGNGAVENAGQLNSDVKYYYSTAVMYRPGQILQVGGPSQTGAILIDIRNGAPIVSQTNDMNHSRYAWANSTVLPDGTVLVTGGSGQDNALVEEAYTAEIWDPETGQWTTAAKASLARLYHSTSLLLPDGRVLITGGGAPGPLTNTNAEIFSPGYLLTASGEPRVRPTMTGVPAILPANGAISFSSNEDISRLTFVRTGAVTHSFNMEQRFYELAFTQANGQVNTSVSTDRNFLPPGHYILYALNDEGTPSEGQIVQVKSDNASGYNTALFGGAGGGEASSQCASDEVLVGVSGRSGSTLDYVAAQCVKVDGSGNWQGQPRTVSNGIGGAGGGAFTLTCPTGSGVVSARTAMDTGAFSFVLGYLDLQCQALTGVGSVDSGSAVNTRFVGDNPGNLQTLACNDGDVASGLFGQGGWYVDSIGLSCR
ncbi:galactose oxidase-like domain-containing protein [Enterovibrio norvegicus]|uniref:galactose oxidase-like domain-containing protein n=2 Tax=Enterovibrio norvegicus TaxID=188144 RepID=UPI00352EE02B